MTLTEMKQSSKIFLSPRDVAEVIGVKPYSINCQAHKDISALGFPASLVGTRVRIPREPFIRWVEGE